MKIMLSGASDSIPLVSASGSNIDLQQQQLATLYKCSMHLLKHVSQQLHFSTSTRETSCSLNPKALCTRHETQLGDPKKFEGRKTDENLSFCFNHPQIHLCKAGSLKFEVFSIWLEKKILSRIS
jgi:hypothetical protein